MRTVFLLAGLKLVAAVSYTHLLDFTQFLHESGAARFGRLGKAASLFTRFGLYDADFFERWLSELLAKRGVRSFGTLALPSPRQDGVRRCV